MKNGARLAVALLLLGACQAGVEPSARRYATEMSQAQPAQQHAVASERLREIMQGLERLRVERLPQELDRRPERRLDRGDVERLSHSLAEAAVRIPEAAGELGLDEESRREFARLAQTLGQQSSELSEESRTASVVDLRARLREIDATCDACHQRFRIAPLRSVP